MLSTLLFLSLTSPTPTGDAELYSLLQKCVGAHKAATRPPPGCAFKNKKHTASVPGLKMGTEGAFVVQLKNGKKHTFYGSELPPVIAWSDRDEIFVASDDDGESVTYTVVSPKHSLVQRFSAFPAMTPNRQCLLAGSVVPEWVDPQPTELLVMNFIRKTATVKSFPGYAEGFTTSVKAFAFPNPTTAKISLAAQPNGGDAELTVAMSYNCETGTLSVAADESAPPQHVVVIPGLSLRATPKPGSQRLMVLPFLLPVRVLDPNAARSKWMHVQVAPGIRGYAAARYVMPMARQDSACTPAFRKKWKTRDQREAELACASKTINPEDDWDLWAATANGVYAATPDAVTERAPAFTNLRANKDKARDMY